MSLVAVMGVRSHGGSGNVASADVSTGAPHMEIDLVKETGEAWCQSITTSASRIANGTPYEVAVCISDVADADNNPITLGAFQFDFKFDPQLNSCTEKGGTASPALDANPDANEGTLSFSTPDLGAGWDCNILSAAPPTCAKGGVAGTAFIKCQCVSTAGCTSTLATGVGVSKPLAVITLNANAPGPDALKIVNGHAFDLTAGGILDCDLNGLPATACKGATETKQTPPPTPTPVPPGAECDIGVSVPMAANPPALNLKVGQTATIVDLTSTWKNYGAVTQGAPAATCNFALAEGAAIYVSGPTPLVTTAIDPTKLAVRMVPAPAIVVAAGPPPIVLPGDVCLSCTSTQGTKSVGDCLDPTKGAKGPFDPVPTPLPSTWTYTVMPCQETGFDPGFPLNTSLLADGGCRDGIDNNIPLDGTYDWKGFSAAPDPMCMSVQAIGLIPAMRVMLAPNGTSAKARQVEVQCLARGVYPLFVFGGNSQATDYVAVCPDCPVHNVPPASDPNVANNSSGAVVMVTCTQGPEMVKDCDPLTTGIQTACNLWLMNPKFPGGPEYGTNPPVILPKADANGCVLPDKGKGCLAVDVWLKSAADDDDPNDADLIPECLGAWEHQVRYDHKIIRFVNDLNPKTLGVPPNQFSWLESTGRIANCTISVLAENWILEGCVTTDNGGLIQNGPCGDGIIEKMLIIPQTNDLIYRGVFRPTKDNGVITNIVDDNCEITDIYAEPMADTLPGGLTPICGDLTITVRMLEGDIDLDCDVDVIDDAALAMRYGASWGLYLYDQWYDLEPKYADQDIDIKDLQFVFGRNYSTCQAPIPDDQSIPYDPGQP